MHQPVKIIEINYHFHPEFTKPEQVIAKHRPSNLFAEELKQDAEIILVKHLDYTGGYADKGIHYHFFKRRNGFWQIPFSTHRFVKSERPDIVLVQGFIYPLQVIVLRRKLGRSCKIILQHRADKPFKKKKLFQRLADRFIDAYLFTSFDMAAEWIAAGIIKDKEKCFELPGASTLFTKKNKELSRQKTGMDGSISFLWVGRLNENKDPITVLKGFEKYFAINPAAKLYMIYQEDDLLDEVRGLINQSQLLKDHVVLVGKIAYPELELWYNAADYFISGSHSEGGSYALMEAMACGCVPIVTNIPAAMKMIDRGNAGYYYEAGNAEDLFMVLSQLDNEKQDAVSRAAMIHFKEELSPGAIAGKFMSIYKELAGM
jgi:glycosyltransferase involved in cell wall biosynthesis